MSKAIERLMQIGRKSLDGREQLNYADYGIGLEHVPELITLAQRMTTEDDTLNDKEGYASVHAWRALAQLGDPRAIPALVELYGHDDDDCDWILGELGFLLAQFGETAMPALERLLAQRDYSIYARASAAEALQYIAEKSPELRARCVDIIARGLADFEQEEVDYNSLLAGALVSLSAVEQAPLLQCMFEKNCIDWSHMGDWEEVQIELGLLDKRSSPKPDFHLWGRNDAERAESKERQAMMELYLESRDEDEREEQYYRLRIELDGVSPAIWRQLELSSKTTLPELHRFLQAVMGWANCHDHEFIDQHGHIFVDQYSMPNAEDERRFIREELFTLSSLARAPGDSFFYRYDLGDNWRHTVTLEAMRPFMAIDSDLPVCVDGARNCPPEDCGGVPGYTHLLQILADPAHEQYQEKREWLGEDFDAELFTIEDTNVLLEMAAEEGDEDDDIPAPSAVGKNKNKKAQRKKQKQARKAQRKKKKR